MLSLRRTIISHRTRMHGTAMLGTTTRGAAMVSAAVHRPASRARANHSSARKRSRSRGRGDGRPAVINRGSELSVAGRRPLMVSLHRRNFDVTLMLRGHLVSGRSGLDTIVATIEAHAIHSDVVDHGSVVDICNMNGADVGDRAVIEIIVTPPVTTLEADTAISEAVVHAAVKPNMRPPIAAVPEVNAVGPTPVAGRPQHAGRRRLHPCAGHPVVVTVIPSPVARRPDVTRRGKRRLHVDRQCRRSDVDGDSDGNSGERHRGEHGKRGE
jgi:hypothetical protein